VIEKAELEAFLAGPWAQTDKAAKLEPRGREMAKAGFIRERKARPKRGHAVKQAAWDAKKSGGGAPEAAAASQLRRVLETGEPLVEHGFHGPIPGKPEARWDHQLIRADPIYIIKKPVLTEKSTAAMHDEGSKGERYTFEVDRRATKTDIKRAVKALYNVEVERVQTRTYKGGGRRLRYGYVSAKTRKTATVRLKEVQSIELF